MIGKIRCSEYKHCNLACEHKELHYPLYRKQVNFMHDIGCHDNPCGIGRHSGRCEPIENIKEQIK